MINKIKDFDLNQSLVGILWMVITTILFVGVTATVRYLEGEVPAPQGCFFKICNRDNPINSFIDFTNEIQTS